VRSARAVAVDDRRQPLHVGAQDLGERFTLGLAQLGELLRDVRYRAVVLAQLNAVDRPSHRRHSGRVAGLRQRGRNPVGLGFNVARPFAYSRKDAVYTASREGADGVVAADLPQLAHRGNRKVVVRVLQLGPACGRERTQLG